MPSAVGEIVGTRVVSHGSSTGDAKEFHQVIPKMGLKLSSSVRSEGGWNAKSCDPTKQKYLGFCAGVSERDDFWPMGEAVHAGEDMGEAMH